MNPAGFFDVSQVLWNQPQRYAVRLSLVEEQIWHQRKPAEWAFIATVESTWLFGTASKF